MGTQILLTVPDELYRRVEQLARSRKQNIDAVLVDVLDEVLPRSQKSTVEDNLTYEPDEAVEREKSAYIALHPALWQKYPGQHVAIYNGQLVDHDVDFAALYDRIDRQYPDEFVWLTQVKPEPIETVVVRSPRFVRNED
jgi:hypothetical protein